MNRPRCFLPVLGLINALGRERQEICAGLMAGASRGLRLEDGWLREGPARVGRVDSELPEIPAAFARHRSRNNRLLLVAVQQIERELRAASARYGNTRIGIVLGTSTSGIAEGEAAIARLAQDRKLPPVFHYEQQEISDPAVFLARYLDIRGPAYVVSTACTSSAQAFASARNLLFTNLCDAVIVGGCDTLCRLTLNGFTALESTTSEVCNPFSAHRRGINIGEAAAVFLLSREPADIELLGVGESSDAYHISAPDPEGRGAERAMRAALADAGLKAEDIAYINLHGTATPKNDEMESKAVHRVFPGGVLCSSTKPLTGHTLGAAGATELGFCWLALSPYNTACFLPPHIWDGVADTALPELHFTGGGEQLPARGRRVLMSNSFAFGGNNVSLLIGDAR